MSSSKKKRKLNQSTDSPAPKQAKEEIPLVFQGLPKEVLDVADRIGLKTNVSRNDIDEFVESNIGDVSKDSKSLMYSCKKTGEKILEYAKIKREKSRRIRKRKRDKTKLTSKERKKLFNVDRTSDLKFTTFEEIHEVWKDYIAKVVQDPNSPSDQLKLIRADFHGAYFTVYSSQNPSLVGIKGIVVQETKLTFKLIDESNKISVIPKIGTVFSFILNDNLFKLNGSCLNFNPHHRSKIKVKTRKFTEEF